jgi:hypothetical protein
MNIKENIIRIIREETDNENPTKREGDCLNCGKHFEYRPSQYKTTTNPEGIKKFCSNQCQGEFGLKQTLTRDSEYRHKTQGVYVKKLQEKEYGKNFCEICKIDSWNGKPIVYDVDHVDGNRTNNTLQNLMIVCPNCHRQTETWGSKNMSDSGRERCKTNQKYCKI